MAATLGVVAGFLGPAIEIGKLIYRPIKRQFNYLCCFNSNVRNLEDESRKLEEKRAGLQMQVDTEENNAQVVLPEVKAWIGEAIRTHEEVIETENEITTTRNGGFTLKPHYSLSRKVKKTAEAIKELREKCDFKEIANPPPPAALVRAPLESNFQFFDSRKDIEEGVMASLRDNETYRVGICGMGGVGKTTMAKKIIDRGREEHLFEEILMVVVSQTADPLKIQKSLAESLGLKLEDESLPARAHLLRTRLHESKKRSLIVVDDVWENLKLEDLGIVCNSQCKVLLTSRNRDVLRRMNVEKLHVVQVLSESEAWGLFTLYIGSCIEHQTLKSIAREIIAECKGLPVALVTVGASLKGEENAGVWKDWLHQLKSNNPNGLPEILDDVYKPLRLSYELLKDDEAKSLFLLCCLYPEDDDIPLSELAIYATGLRMLRGMKSLEEARNRVCSLVKTLKSRFLLLEGKNNDHVKMHDVVRDVAIFIASEKKLIACDSEMNDCTWISPHVGERMELQAGSTVFPSLRLLWIDCYYRDEELEIYSQFFEGMKQLNVLSIIYPSLQQLPQTLVNLQTLVLEYCYSLESISVVGELVNLKILICRWCKSIESLPIEMKRLRHLRLLELSNCRKLKTIEPGIISNLKALEELIIEGSFDEWQAENFEKGKKNALLSELEKLSSLRLLKIEIKDSSLVNRLTSLSPNMVRFHIRIGETCDFDESMIYDKIMELELPENTTMGEGFVKCLESVEELYLKGDGSSLDFGVAKEIKVLVIEECSLKEICDMDRPMPSTFLRNLRELRLKDLPALEHLNVVSNFNKLSVIRVSDCNRLKNLFSVTSHSSLAQLKSLEIKSCDMMEQVFLWNNEENQFPLVFADLKSLILESLPKLTSFSKGIGSIEFPVLEELEVCFCPMKNFVSTISTKDDDAIHLFCKHDKIKFDCLRTLRFKHVNFEMTGIWCPQVPLNFFFPRLRELVVVGLNGLKSLFSLSTTENDCLSQLERLHISDCDMMEEVILWNEEETSNRITLIFPKLKFLSLRGLSMLTSFSQGIESIEFPVLEEIRVRRCPTTTFVSMDSSTTCPNHDDDVMHMLCKSDKVEFSSLKTLYVCGYRGRIRYWCRQLPMIDIFSGLSELRITSIDGIKSLFSCSVAQNLQNLRCLAINLCDEMVRVIEDEDDACGGETPPFLLFPNLEELDLRCLPKLKSFCEWRCALEFLLLTRLYIYECEVMEKFTSGPLNTPLLECIFINPLQPLLITNDRTLPCSSAFSTEWRNRKGNCRRAPLK